MNRERRNVLEDLKEKLEELQEHLEKLKDEEEDAFNDMESKSYNHIDYRIWESNIKYLDYAVDHLGEALDFIDAVLR